MKKKERLQKILANQGLDSRRKIEKLISSKKIKINGKIAKLGEKITKKKDKIFVNGKQFFIKDNKNLTKFIIFHKSEGQICSTNDFKKKKSVFHFLPKIPFGKWIMIGRLDINTSGLLLFTNNGDIAHKLMHPFYKIEREYLVRVMGKIDDIFFKHFIKGVQLKDGVAKFSKIIDMNKGKNCNHWYKIITITGKNRQIRRMLKFKNLLVNRLIRIRYGCIKLPKKLSKGTWKFLESKKIQDIYKMIK